MDGKHHIGGKEKYRCNRVVKVLRAVNMVDTVKVEKKDEMVETVNVG